MRAPHGGDNAKGAAVASPRRPLDTGDRFPLHGVRAHGTILAASIISAAILLIVIPQAMHKFGQQGELNLRAVTRLVAIEYGLFLAGALCFAWRLTALALAATSG